MPVIQHDMTDDKGLLEDILKSFLDLCAPNPYKPSVLFVGHGQTVQTQIKEDIVSTAVKDERALGQLNNVVFKQQQNLGRRIDSSNMYLSLPSPGGLGCSPF